MKNMKSNKLSNNLGSTYLLCKALGHSVRNAVSIQKFYFIDNISELQIRKQHCTELQLRRRKLHNLLYMILSAVIDTKSILYL